jgi:hypothetical protein
MIQEILIAGNYYDEDLAEDRGQMAIILQKRDHPDINVYIFT